MCTLTNSIYYFIDFRTSIFVYDRTEIQIMGVLNSLDIYIPKGVSVVNNVLAIIGNVEHTTVDDTEYECDTTTPSGKSFDPFFIRCALFILLNIYLYSYATRYSSYIS